MRAVTGARWRWIIPDPTKDLISECMKCQLSTHGEADDCVKFVDFIDSLWESWLLWPRWGIIEAHGCLSFSFICLTGGSLWWDRGLEKMVVKRTFFVLNVSIQNFFHPRANHSRPCLLLLFWNDHVAYQWDAISWVEWNSLSREMNLDCHQLNNKFKSRDVVRLTFVFIHCESDWSSGASQNAFQVIIKINFKLLKQTLWVAQQILVTFHCRRCNARPCNSRKVIHRLHGEVSEDE